MSTDEMTGVRVLERLHPCLPMRPGLVERQEFEYKWHGTVSLIANRVFSILDYWGIFALLY